MLRTFLSQASRLCEPLACEALSLQQGALLPRLASTQTLVTLRRFSTEESSPSAPVQQAAAPGAAAGSPKGVQQWRQWVDAKIGEKLDGKAEEKPDDEPGAAEATPAEAAAPMAAAAAAAAEPSTSAPREHFWPPPGVAEELQDLLKPEQRRSRRTVEEEIFEIIVPASTTGPVTHDRDQSYKVLAQATEAPRLFPGSGNKAEEVSPNRIHPYRLFYPGQLYSPQDLDPYQAVGSPFGMDHQKRAQKYISRAEVEAKADFRNAQFLTSFVTEAGKLVPRRRTRLQAKLHRHLCRQVKVARIMAILPPDSRLPQFQPRRRAPRATPAPLQAAEAAAAKLDMV